MCLSGLVNDAIEDIVHGKLFHSCLFPVQPTTLDSKIRSMRNVFRPVVGFAALILAMSTGLAGCSTPSSTSSSQQAKAPSQSVTTAPSLKQKQGTKKAKPQKATTDSATGTTAESTQQRSQICTTSELSASVTFGAGSGAGSTYPYLVLTNKGNRTCLERGYPGVSLQANGKQIGAAANRDTSVSPVNIQLKPGESVHSELQIVNAENVDSRACSAQQADALLVFPPDQTEALKVPTSDYKGCANVNTSLMRVRPLQPGKE